MNEIDTNQLLTQMKVLAAKARDNEISPNQVNATENEFGNLLKNAIDKVNQYQVEANDLAVRFDSGDESVNLTQVMVALQKSNVSLQAMSQVRNRLVSAYQEIMNMPI
ncbi:MAG: flagellar hook-basal body complex protein FliE [Gammaproteobacteria bacterium]|nr:flagellar hook-basal body complex protein FliE [Gammaproteobacteria bacterium]